MDKIKWIKDLVIAEQAMEESGVIDLSAEHSHIHLEVDTIEFLKDLKIGFIESAATFNQLKGSTLGNIKVYGIAKTKADFMLFRNGFKLIFSMSRPGLVEVYYSTLGGLPGAAKQKESEKDQLEAHWGPFGELKWTYKNHQIKYDYLIRHYLSRFIKESAK